MKGEIAFTTAYIEVEVSSGGTRKKPLVVISTGQAVPQKGNITLMAAPANDNDNLEDEGDPLLAPKED